VGAAEGSSVVGAGVGVVEGTVVGCSVGRAVVGEGVGTAVGSEETGAAVGMAEGLKVGSEETGAAEGMREPEHWMLHRRLPVSVKEESKVTHSTSCSKLCAYSLETIAPLGDSNTQRCPCAKRLVCNTYPLVETHCAFHEF